MNSWIFFANWMTINYYFFTFPHTYFEIYFCTTLSIRLIRSEESCSWMTSDHYLQNSMRQTYFLWGSSQNYVYNTHFIQRWRNEYYPLSVKRNFNIRKESLFYKIAYCFERLVVFWFVLSTWISNYLLFLTSVDKSVAVLSKELLKLII